MFKKLAAGLATLALVFGAAAFSGSEQNYPLIGTIEASAETYDNSEDFDWWYFDDGTIHICNYSGNDKDVIIPDTINGLPVTGIGSYAFEYNDSIESVTIPDTVTYIGDFAFDGCSSLSTINIPNTVEWIGESAFYGCSALCTINIPENVTNICSGTFYGCSSLSTINIPENVSYIDNNAFYGCSSLSTINIPENVTDICNGTFYGCSSLSTINIPENVTYIGDNTFSGCTSLLSIDVDPNNEYYSSEDGVLFDKDKSTLIRYPAGKTNSSYVIPDSVYWTAWYAFSENIYLASVTLPEGMTSIDSYAFSDCTSLEEVKSSYPLDYFGDHAFYNCSLSSIDISDNTYYIGVEAFFNTPILNNQTSDIKYIGKWAVDANGDIVTANIKSGTEYIGNNAFEDCTLLTNVTIPNTVGWIGDSAFYGCSSLTSIDIPEGITYIDSNTFENCTSLENIIIPDTVTYIGRNAFSGCSSLTSIDIPEYVTEINPFTFSGCSSLASVTIPNTVEWIGESAFYGCSSLTSIDIPEGVTDIDGNAFENCTSLKNVTIPDTVSYIGWKAFFGCSSLKSVIIPKNAEDIGYDAFGYYNKEYYTEDGSVDSYWAPVEDFKIYCFRDSAGEQYAIDNDFEYEFLDPAKPTIKISSADSSTIKLSWNKVADADGYVVYRQDGTTWKRLGTTTSTSYTYKNLSANKTYKLAVRAYKMVDGVEYKSDFTTANDAVTAYTAPAKPSIKISSADSSTIKLSWNKVTGAQGYVVYRLDGTTWKRLGTTTSTSYTYKNLSANKTYKLAVRAYKVVGGVEYKSTFTTANDAVTAYTAPAKPTIKISSADSNTIKLSWNKVTGAQGYVVYRLDGSTWKRLGTTTATSYTYKSLSANKTYKLAVRAYKVVGGVEYKSTFTAANDAITAYTAPAKPTIKIASAGSNTIKLSWNKVTGAQGYVVYRLDGSTWKRLGTTTSTSYTYKNLSANKTYKLAVRAYKVVGGVEYKSTFTAANDAVTAYTAPAKPTITSATSTKNTVTLKWNKVSGAKGYIVYKKVNGSWVRQGVTTSTSYTFKSLKSGTTYTFAVKPYKVVNGTTLNGTYVSKSVKTK